MNYRPERVASLIREELSAIIIKNVEFPAGSLVTITDVNVDKKLEHAKVGISVLPSEGADKVLHILGKCAGHLQYLLMKRVNIKPLPRIVFEIDHGIEKLAKIEKILLDDKID
ncbi:MAG: 30S ribosome-binding factor RbfA [Candidatus Paceibacterota bacterium]